MSLEVRQRISKNIKVNRERAGLTQSELAKKLKVSVRYVSMLEDNARNLSVKSLCKVADCLDIDVAELICDDSYLSNRKESAAKLGIELLQKYIQKQAS